MCLEPSKCNFICAFDVTIISQSLQNLDGSFTTFSEVIFGDVTFGVVESAVVVVANSGGWVKPAPIPKRPEGSDSPFDFL